MLYCIRLYVNRRRWGVTGIISAALSIAFFVWFVYAIDDTILADDIEACEDGRTSPEELGYPDMTCKEIEEKGQNDAFGEMIPFFLFCGASLYALFAILIAAFKKDGGPQVVLAGYSEEAARLQTQLQQTQTILSQAEMDFQQRQHAHQQAEAQFTQARMAQSELAGDAAAAHASRMRELKTAEQSAREKELAARSAVEKAEKARLESDAAAATARMERLAAQGAKQELIQAAQNIAPQPTQSQAPQFNVNIVNKEYKDSVHQEEK
jgi:hypothetical protein